MRNRFGLFGALLLTTPVASAQISPTSPTTSWVPVIYGPTNPTIPDPFSDQQTGSREGDIVGNSTTPSFYTAFYNGGTPALTDGMLGFRFRMAEQQNPPGYSGAAFVGIDGNGDGRLDVFVGANNSGSANQIGIWLAGPGLNNSPSTTTIQNTAGFSYSEVGINYSWTPVNAVIDPTTVSYDLDNGGNPDYFLTFVIPFADLVSAFATAGISGINQNSIFSYVAATATQQNSLNQDINGVNGGLNSSTPWGPLGGISLPITASGVTPVPEPSTWAFLALGATTMWFVRRRKK